MMSTLFDTVEAKSEREKAIDKVEKSQAEWMASFTASVLITARRKQVFTTDDVFREYPDLEECGEKRIMGAAIRVLRQQGIIEPTGQYVDSNRVASHARPKREWRLTK